MIFIYGDYLGTHAMKSVDATDVLRTIIYSTDFLYGATLFQELGIQL